MARNSKRPDSSGVNGRSTVSTGFSSVTVFWPTTISGAGRRRRLAREAAGGDGDRDRFAGQAALPQLDQHAAPLGLLHLGIGLHIDGQIDRLGRADADGIDRHAQAGGRRLLARAERGDARVVGKVAEHHDARQPARAELLAHLVHDRAQRGHLPLGRELIGQVFRIDRRPPGASRAAQLQLAQLAGRSRRRR